MDWLGGPSRHLAQEVGFSRDRRTCDQPSREQARLWKKPRVATRHRSGSGAPVPERSLAGLRSIPFVDPEMVGHISVSRGRLWLETDAQEDAIFRSHDPAKRPIELSDRRSAGAADRRWSVSETVW